MGVGECDIFKYLASVSMKTIGNMHSDISKMTLAVLAHVLFSNGTHLSVQFGIQGLEQFLQAECTILFHSLGAAEVIMSLYWQHGVCHQWFSCWICEFIHLEMFWVGLRLPYTPCSLNEFGCRFSVLPEAEQSGGCFYSNFDWTRMNNSWKEFIWIVKSVQNLSPCFKAW